MIREPVVVGGNTNNNKIRLYLASLALVVEYLVKAISNGELGYTHTHQF